ncbi:MAG: hypothetical protein IKE04_02755 [Oscillospiraceae bacterium]|nr:hypothetical protein [Oscillospiraceae bacterium]
MDSAILVAVITAGVGLVGTIITVLAANKSTLSAMSEQSKLADEKIQGQINVIQTEIKTLSDRVEKHNSIIERTFHLVAHERPGGKGQGSQPPHRRS